MKLKKIYAIKIIYLVLLSSSFFIFSPLVSAEGKSCTSATEGERSGPYVCENGRWVYIGQHN